MNVNLYLCGGEQPISEFPLGLGYLKSNADKKHKITILKNKENIYDCDIVCLSSNAWGANEAIDILKKSTVPVVIGGQITLWNDLQKYEFACIVKGEGEFSFNSILKNGIENKILCAQQNDDIDSISYPERGECSTTVPIITSRGCPFSCSFCSSKTFLEKTRYHSAEYFINEIEYILSRYKSVKELYILDDLFIANKKRFFEIHDLWMKKGFHNKIHPKSFVRSSIFTEEIGLAMKEMGFSRVRFGAESGSDSVLKRLNKKCTVKNHQDTIDIANKIGLPVSASFMYDTPSETPEERNETKVFIEKNKGKLIVEGYYKFRAFPGTDFYNGEDISNSDMRVR